MSKKLIVVLALAFVVGITAAAFAEVQNVKVGGDITSVVVSRQQLDLQGKNLELSADNEFATISRIKIDANLTDNVDVTFRLLNERVWGGATGNTGTDTSTSEIDIDVAYVTLKEFLKETTNVPLNLIIGRQNIKIGSGLLIGANGTNQGNSTQLPVGANDLSVRSAFDAIVGIWDFTPELSVTTGMIKATEGSIAAGKDTDIYVVDAVYKLGEDAMNSVVEGTYALKHTTRNDINNFGGRVTSTPVENLNIEAEYVYQTARSATAGDMHGTSSDWLDENHKTKASDAVRLGATYALPDVTWKPAFGIDFTRLSKNWNKMDESLVPADLANLILANSNVKVLGFTASAKPQDDVTLKLRYANFALAKKGVSSIVDTNYTATTYTMDSTKKALGYEVDAGIAYDYTADVQFGLNYGIFSPGKAFSDTNRKSASQVIGSMKVSF